MARLFVTSINLNKNELQNARIQNLSSAPSSPVAGQIYFDTTTNVLYFYNGTSWVPASGATDVIQDVIGSSVIGGTGLTASYDNVSGETTIDLDDTAVTSGSYGSADSVATFTVDDQGRLTAASNQSIQISTGQVTGLEEYIQDVASSTITAGNGIDVEYNDSNGTITVSAELASDTNQGVASFNATDFTVTNGEVTIKDEKIEDVVSNLVSGGNGIDVSYDDLDSILDISIDNTVVTLSDVQTLTNKTLDSGVSLAAPLDADNNTITNLPTPINPGDAANKAYVDNAVSGLDWKDAVNLLADSNVALTGNTNTLVIDGHAALVQADSGYRILLKNQSTDSENGIYVYNDNGTTYTLTRTQDADSFEELVSAAVFVLEGSTYANTAWVQSDHYLTNFENQFWYQFSGAGAYTAGDGLGQQGTVFNVGAGLGITVDSDSVAIDTAVVARKYATAIGNNADLQFTVTHNLNTKDVTVQIYENSGSGAQIEADVEHANVNHVIIKFATAPASNEYRVIVVG